MEALVARIVNFLPFTQLLKEGITDIVFAIEKLHAGHNFSWADYGRHKHKSLLSTAGISHDSYKRGMDFIKKHILRMYVPKTDDRSVELSKHSKIVKRNDERRTKITKSMRLGLTYQGIVSAIESKLSIRCTELEEELLEETTKVVDRFGTSKYGQKAIVETDEVHHRAKVSVDEKLNKITRGWIKHGEIYLSRGLLPTIAKRLAENLSSSETSSMGEATSKLTDNVTSTIDSIVKEKLVTKLGKILEEKLNETLLQRDRIDTIEFKFQLKETSEKLIKIWREQLLDLATRHVTTLASRAISHVYQEGGHESYRELSQQGQQVKDEGTTSTQASSTSVDGHVASCFKVLKETRDPILFSAFIRENLPVPADPFCAHALSCTIPTILRDTQVPLVFIRIESFDEILFENAKDKVVDNVFVVKIHQTTTGNQSDLFYVSTEDGEGIGCMLESVTQQITKRFPQTAGYDWRQKVAEVVETNSSVFAEIRSGWNSHILRIGLFGMGKEKNYKRITKKTSADKDDAADETNRRGVYQHPGYACIEKYAKDEGIRKIRRENHPVIKIPYHQQRKSVFEQHQDAHQTEDGVDGKNAVLHLETFQNIQRGYLERGEYKSAIWNSIETYLIPIIEREKEVKKKEEYISAALDHFNAYSLLERRDKSVKTVVSKDECEEMKLRLLCYTPNIIVSHEFWKNMMDSIKNAQNNC